MAKKKSFLKKPKTKLSSSKVIMLTAVIASVCVFMLFLSILFQPNNTKNEKPQKNQTQSVAVEPKVSVPKNTESQPAKKDTQTTKKTPTPAEKEPASQKPAVNSPSSPPSPVEQVSKPSVKTNDVPSKPSNPVQQEEKKVVPIPPVQEKSAVKESDAYSDIPAAVNNAVLVYVFDDGGQNLSLLKKYLDFEFPVTIAVLPGLVHSVESATLIRNSKHELMLHQPMQALNLSVSPGPGAILPDMRISDVFNIISKNIEEIGPVAGFNNHEGSLIMENEVLAGAIVEVAQELGIYFLDSRTTANTRVPQAALERGMKIYNRDIFLDNEHTRENVESELKRGLAIANKKGYCIMIGHVQAADVIAPVLNEFYPVLLKKGYKFSVVSKSGAAN